jgi:uncharacterized OsmC-like protein
MYQLTLDDSNQIQVSYKNHQLRYGLDGSLPNPLEATYAALAGCAGVYSRKACKTLQISAAGIEISCRPVVRSSDTLVPTRFVTEVHFPEKFTAGQREKILEEIRLCAVKQLINEGKSIDFVTVERVSA